MIVFIYGKDSYRLLQEKRKRKNAFLQKHNNAKVAELDFQNEKDKKTYEDLLGNNSLFGTAKFVVVKNAIEKDALEPAKRFLNDKTTCILFAAEKKPPKKYKFLLGGSVDAKYIPELSDKEVVMFIESEAEKAGVNVSDKAVYHLKKIYGKDSWSIATEIQKLACLNKKTIKVDDLLAVGVEAPPTFFSLLQNIKNRPKRSVVALSRLFSMGEDPAKLFYVLASQWTAAAQNFAEHDREIKSGGWDYEEALLALALRGEN